jgi:hypothetical protein
MGAIRGKMAALLELRMVQSRLGQCTAKRRIRVRIDSSDLYRSIYNAKVLLDRCFLFRTSSYLSYVHYGSSERKLCGPLLQGRRTGQHNRYTHA